MKLRCGRQEIHTEFYLENLFKTTTWKTEWQRRITHFQSGTGSVSCPVAVITFSAVEPSVSALTVLLCQCATRVSCIHITLIQLTFLLDHYLLGRDALTALPLHQPCRSGDLYKAELMRRKGRVRERVTALLIIKHQHRVQKVKKVWLLSVLHETY
jgi:hypothetical protein